MSKRSLRDFETLKVLALALPREQQLELADLLWVSIGPTYDEELFAEIERREAAIESGADEAIPFDMDEIRQSLAKRLSQ